MRLIGLTGYARSGKDTVANVIEHALRQRAVRLAFAEPIKRFCREVFGWTTEHTDGVLKEEHAPGWRRPDNGPLTPRFAMQTLGTEWGRNCDPDVWVKALLAKAKHEREQGTPLCIVTDVRFINEAAALRDAGGEIWRIQRDVQVSTHPSETEIWSAGMAELVTLDIDNRGYLGDTYVTVCEALGHSDGGKCADNGCEGWGCENCKPSKAPALDRMKARHAEELADAQGLSTTSHERTCVLCQNGDPCTCAAVDATLDVTAELARVTAELDELKKERDGLRFDLATASDRIDTLIKECDAEEARAEKAEKQVAVLRAALQRLASHVNVTGIVPAPALKRALDVLADPNLGAGWVPRAELEKAKRMGELALGSAERAEARLTETQERHQAELRRVAEAVRTECVRFLDDTQSKQVDWAQAQVISALSVCLSMLDLDAIIRGTR